MNSHDASFAIAGTDAQLVDRSRSGDRDPFALLVGRYQSLVCSIAYSATGSLARSEDLAQETFLAAWRQLDSLRDATRLRAWLCGIARNLTRNAQRRGAREPAASGVSVETIAQVAAPGPGPAEQAVTREEEALVWQALERIPPPYREPLILYYREGESPERAAEQLELSQEALRQRLSRGRQMLRAQVLGMVAGTLRRSAPGKAFTLGVIAALPFSTTSVTAAAVGTAAVKGSGAARAAAGLGWLGAVAGPLVGILGGYLGAKASIENTQSPRERQFMVRTARWSVAYVLVFLVLMFLLLVRGKALWQTHPALLIWLVVILSVAYSAGLMVLILKANRRQREIRQEEPAKRLGPDPTRAVTCARPPRSYRSSLRLLGLPLVDIQMGGPLADAPQWARGWIAVGDRACGVLLALGGVAVGGISIGGVTVGAIALGGLSLGALAVGGLAIGGWAAGGVAAGYMAYGGAALAWYGAEGGAAVARVFAVGGSATAAHANDSLATAFFQGHPFFSATPRLFQHSRWAPLLALLPVALTTRRMRRAQGCGTEPRSSMR